MIFPYSYAKENDNDTDECNFRALVIGETAYTTRLNGPDNDMNFMKNMLTKDDKNYQVIAQENATRDEIIELVDLAFMDATDKDVSLFYYSGHGITGAGEEYSGALQTYNYEYITVSDLADILSYVPGKVVVILDSCGSGAAISEGEDERDMHIQNDHSKVDSAVKFNEAVINAFAGHGDHGNDKAGELREDKFLVLTGSAYEENSLTTMIDGVWGAVLTRGIAGGCGLAFPGADKIGEAAADENGDEAISFSELSDFCKEYAGDRQHVLSYIGSSDIILLGEAVDKPKPDPEDPKEDNDKEIEPVHVHDLHWTTIKDATESEDGIVAYACSSCGYQEQVTYISAYNLFNVNTASKIKNAALNETVRIETDRWLSFHKMVFDALTERPDVSIDVTYLSDGYKGENEQLHIPAGIDWTTILDGQMYAGFKWTKGTELMVH